MAEYLPIRLGLSQAFECSYLDGQKEQLLVIMENSCNNAASFEKLLNLGFRRSGNQIYRPHCPSCHQCQSLRVLSHHYKPSGSQKRLFNKAKKQFEFKVTQTEKLCYYPLYELYIQQRHYDGSMYPPQKEQYDSFLYCDWLTPLFIELWHGQQLIAVAVTDTLPFSLSAIYTFFHPDYSQFSLGKLMIMKQIELAKNMGKPYVYLGYQIDECVKMQYKKQFKPYEQLISGSWQRIIEQQNI